MHNEILGFVAVALIIVVAAKISAPDSLSGEEEHVLQTYLPGESFTVADESYDHPQHTCYFFLSYKRIDGALIKIQAIDRENSFQEVALRASPRLVIFNGCSELS